MRNLNEIITYWSVQQDDFGGYTFGDPVELNGRWETMFDKIMLSTGEEVKIANKVYLDGDVQVGGYLYQGLSYSADPVALGAMIIRQFKKVSSLRNKEYLRVAYG